MFFLYSSERSSLSEDITFLIITSGWDHTFAYSEEIFLQEVI